MKLSFVLMLCCFSLPACGLFKTAKSDEEKPKPQVTGPKLVGRIASVPADRRFVLIQSYGPWEIETGQILTTRGLENRTANLRTTGEKLGEFAAADLQSGLVEAGDAVYFQHVPKPVTATESPEVPKPPLPSADAPSGNVQKNN